MLSSHTRNALLLAIGSLAFTPASNAQVTSYFWNSGAGTPGGSGTWQDSGGGAVPVWGTSSSGPYNHTWASDGTERANFGINAGTVTIQGSGVTAAAVTFNTNGYFIGGGQLTLTSGTLLINGAQTGTIASVIAGTNGVSKTGNATIILSGNNLFTGSLAVSGGGTLGLRGTNVFDRGMFLTGYSTVIGTAAVGASPFGASTGSVSIDSSFLRLNGIASTTTTTVADVAIAGTSNSGSGLASLAVDNTDGAGAASTIFSAGNLTRGGRGAVLALTPVHGDLGTGEQVSFANANSLVNHGILSPWIVTQTSGANPAVDFVSNGANGLTYATYSSTNLTTSTSSDAVNQSSPVVAAGNLSAYALKASAAINLNANTLTLGDGTGQSGLILNNGASISNGTVAFTGTEGLLYVSGTSTVGQAGDTLTANGLTIVASGPAVTNINSTLAVGSVTYAGAVPGMAFNLNVAQSYASGTQLAANTGSTGTFNVGNDNAFGAGPINVLPLGLGTIQLAATGGARNVPNTWNLRNGLTFTGTNPFTLSGTVNVLNNATLAANAGAAVTLGASVVNLGDGVAGRTLSFTTTATSTVTVTSVMQDSATGVPGGIQVTGGGTFVPNAQNTYSGSTNLTGAGTVIPIMQNSNALPGAGFTSGPFGTGTVIVNNGTNQKLRPTNGSSRTISNPMSMVTGFTFENFTGETFNLTWAGPISLDSVQGRTVNNNMAAGASMILGASPSSSTLTLNPATDTGNSINLQLTTNATNTIVINDVIRDPSLSPGTFDTVSVTGGGTMVFNGASTYVGTTTFSGAATVVRVGVSSNAATGATSGPFGIGTVNFNNGSNQHIRPDGGDRVIANPIFMTTGFATENQGSDNSNITFSGPIWMSSDRFISNGFSGSPVPTGLLILGSAASPSTLTMGTLNTGRQLSLGGFGPIIVNDVLADPPSVTTGGSVRINPNAGQTNTVTFTNANTYSGTTSVLQGRLIVSNTTGSATGTGAVSVTGTSTLTSGGTLAGNGRIGGPLTISSTTPASQGGTISPGLSVGSLTTASETWNPVGRYVWEYNATNTTTNSGVNDFINSSGNLSLANLSAGAGGQFDLNLIPVAGTPSASPQSYVIATFATGITGPGGPIPNNTDITSLNLFTFSGLYATSPTISVIDAGGVAQSLQLTFQTVPEPGTLLLSALATFGLSLRPRRRRSA